MLCVLLLHWLLLATHPILEPSDKTEFHGHWHEYLYLAIQTLYTLDCFAKIIVYGLWIPPADNQKTGYQLLVQPLVASLIRPWKKFRYQPSSSSQPPQQQQQHDTTTPKVQQHAVYHKAYLNSFGNCLDLASIICYWIDFGLMWNNYTSISVFKAMGAAKPLRLLSILPGTAVILKSLEAGWDLMLDVSGFLFFFLFLFAVVGLVTFGGVYSRQCHYFPNGPNQPVPVYPTQFCSGYYNGTDVVGPFDIVLQKNGFAGRQGRICQSGQMCIANTALNPDDGYMNYDMIFAAFLNVYTFVSMELWTDMMYIAMDADSRLAALYFCLGIYIIGFILVYLLLAVITSAFARVRATSSSSSAFTSSKASRSAASMKHHHILQLLYPPEDDVHHATSTGRANAAAAAAAAAAADADAPWDAKYRLVRWKRRLVRIVSSRAFFYAGGFLVFVDGLFMCLRSVYATEPLLEFLDNVETAFTFIFAIEILIRMLGTLHWMDFWLSTRNRIDLALVIVTCVIQLPTIQDSPMYRYLTIFQVLRLYRLFMCIPRLEKLLFAALGTGESVINVMIFLLLSTALFSPIFMQLFGGDFSYIMEDNDPELRFDTFWQSFLTLIMIYTSETWTGTLYDTMSSQTNGGAIYAALATSLYFYYARYIMSGLYIAVILENFELDDVYIRQYQIQQFIRERMQNTKISGQNLYDNLVDRLVYGKESSASAGQPAADVQIARLPAHLTAGLSKNELVALLAPPSPSFMDEKRAKEHHDHLEREKKERQTHPSIHVFFSWDRNEGITRGTNAEDMDDEDYDLVVAEENNRAMQQDKATRQPVKSLFLFSEDNRLRRFCKRLVGSCKDGRSERQNVFNWVMMLCVLLSILVVILDEPSTRKMDDMSTQRSDVFDTIDLVLGFVFMIELLLRVIADGLLLTPRAYLRHAWNRLDFVVILLNFGTLFANNDQLPRALGTVRSMRILRLIRYFGGMRDVFIDLFHAFPLMMDAMLLTFLVMIPFSIYGVNIFGGRFWTCNDVAVGGRTDCVNEVVLNVGSLDGYDLPLLIPRVWENPGMNLYSFDSFPLALRQLFSLTSTEGWVSSLFYAMSTPAENDTQPVFSWDSPYVYHSIYYVAFMIISHGTVQLFVGVIMEKFKQRSGITTLTFAQRQYVDLQRQLAEVKPTMKPIRPKNALQSLCYEI
ncbi:Ion transport protein-domain-containing protein, partial [Gongronella butleri]